VWFYWSDELGEYIDAQAVRGAVLRRRPVIAGMLYAITECGGLACARG